MRKAELAVAKQQDDLARIAIERSLESKKLAGSFDEQIADQKQQAENLKTALHKLDGKLAEARAKSDVIIAQHRRARALNKAGDARMAMGDDSSAHAFDRMREKARREEAMSQAKAELLGDNVEDKLAELEKQDEIERMLAEIKTRKTPQPSN